MTDAFVGTNIIFAVTSLDTRRFIKTFVDVWYSRYVDTLMRHVRKMIIKNNN